MIYLIRDRDYLKIGHAQNIKQRMDNYKTHNCYFELLSYKEGNYADESYLHTLCSPWHYTLEWFHNVPEVMDMFNNYESLLENVWEQVKKDIEDIGSMIINNHQTSESFAEFKYKCNKQYLSLKEKLELLKKQVQLSFSEDKTSIKKYRQIFDNIYKMFDSIWIKPGIYQITELQTITIVNDIFPTKYDEHVMYRSKLEEQMRKFYKQECSEKTMFEIPIIIETKEGL